MRKAPISSKAWAYMRRRLLFDVTIRVQRLSQRACRAAKSELDARPGDASAPAEAVACCTKLHEPGNGSLISCPCSSNRSAHICQDSPWSTSISKKMRPLAYPTDV